MTDFVLHPGLFLIAAGILVGFLQSTARKGVMLAAPLIAFFLVWQVADGIIWSAGFLINAGAPPLSAWLPDAYPEASWSGTVFLSAFTTKTAVYVLLRGFPSTEILIWIGIFMIFYGIVYALLENDTRWAMYLFSFFCIGLGVWSQPLYDLLPYTVDYEPYTAAHLVTQTQLLLFSGLAFFVMLAYLKRTLTITLDVDWFYRVLFRRIGVGLRGWVSEINTTFSSGFSRLLQRNFDRLYRSHGPQGILARTWPTGSMALWMIVLLLPAKAGIMNAHGDPAQP